MYGEMIVMYKVDNVYDHLLLYVTLPNYSTL